MSKLLRYFAPNQCCFVTSVTADRRPLLTEHCDLLYKSIRHARGRFSFDPIAWAVLPDHFHLPMNCPDGDTNRIVRTIKHSFGMKWRSLTHQTGPIWQGRYWDHIVRDEIDFKRHFDYVHYNPVKHGYTRGPGDWTLSSFHLYLKRGIYQPNWGVEAQSYVGDFGE